MRDLDDCPGCRDIEHGQCPQHGLKITVPCPPSWGRANTRYIQGHRLSPKYKQYRRAVSVGWLKGARVKFHHGPVEITIRSYWPNTRHLDVKVAHGDCDAVVKATLDALERCGCLDDDARVTRIVAEKFVDPKHPRVEVWIRDQGN